MAVSTHSLVNKTRSQLAILQPCPATHKALWETRQRRKLIITEADWQYALGKAGEYVTLRIFLSWPSPSLVDRRALESTIVLGSTGKGGTSTAETTGIVVLPGVKISVDVQGSGTGGKIQHILLRGYLTDWK